MCCNVVYPGEQILCAVWGRILSVAKAVKLQSVKRKEERACHGKRRDKDESFNIRKREQWKINTYWSCDILQSATATPPIQPQHPHPSIPSRMTLFCPRIDIQVLHSLRPLLPTFPLELLPPFLLMSWWEFILNHCLDVIKSDEKSIYPFYLP